LIPRVLVRAWEHLELKRAKVLPKFVGNDENGNVVALGDAEPDFQMSFNNNFNTKISLYPFYGTGRKEAIT